MRTGVSESFLAIGLIFSSACASIKPHIHVTPPTGLIRVPAPTKEGSALVLEPFVYSAENKNGKGVHVQHDPFATPVPPKLPDGRPVPVATTGVLRITFGRNPAEELKPPKPEPKLPGLLDRATGKPIDDKLASPAAQPD